MGRYCACNVCVYDLWSVVSVVSVVSVYMCVWVCVCVSVCVCVCLRMCFRVMCVRAYERCYYANAGPTRVPGREYCYQGLEFSEVPTQKCPNQTSRATSIREKAMDAVQQKLPGFNLSYEALSCLFYVSKDIFTGLYEMPKRYKFVTKEFADHHTPKWALE